MKLRGILFFADRLPPCVGGMEMHARYFISHFSSHAGFPLLGIVTKGERGEDCLLKDGKKKSIEIGHLPKMFSPVCIFFNSGRWIEELEVLRKLFPKAVFIYRTGGNEIIKAPLVKEFIPSHLSRQSYWRDALNRAIDLLITNSSYTEKRLQEMGITSPFARCIGGVNSAVLKPMEAVEERPFTFFCAARFVPYKNHALLLLAIKELVSRGLHFRVRLAGDGPLLVQIKQQVALTNLSSVVKFLGPLNNEEVCREVSRADVYLQLSKDHKTEVPGGSYVHSEGMGRSILEAITSGTFVVAGRGGALSEIVQNNRGVLLEANAVEEIADSLESLIKDPPIRGSFTDEYDWDKVFARYEELLDGCC